MLEPQFHGQTKEKLSNRDAIKLVSGMVRDPFELWMNSHVDWGRKVAELVIRQAVERSRSVQKVERKKSSSVVILPEKLSTNRGDMSKKQQIESLAAIDRQLDVAAQPLPREQTDWIIAALEQDTFRAGVLARLTNSYPRCRTARALAEQATASMVRASAAVRRSMRVPP